MILILPHQVCARPTPSCRPPRASAPAIGRTASARARGRPSADDAAVPPSTAAVARMRLRSEAPMPATRAWSAASRPPACHRPRGGVVISTVTPPQRSAGRRFREASSPLPAPPVRRVARPRRGGMPTPRGGCWWRAGHRAPGRWRSPPTRSDARPPTEAKRAGHWEPLGRGGRSRQCGCRDGLGRR